MESESLSKCLTELSPALEQQKLLNEECRLPSDHKCYILLGSMEPKSFETARLPVG